MKVTRVEFHKSYNILPGVQCSILPNPQKGVGFEHGLELAAVLGGVEIRHPNLKGVCRIVPWTSVVSYDSEIESAVELDVLLPPKVEPKPVKSPDFVPSTSKVPERVAESKPAPAKKRGQYKKRGGKKAVN